MPRAQYTSVPYLLSILLFAWILGYRGDAASGEADLSDDNNDDFNFMQAVFKTSKINSTKVRRPQEPIHRSAAQDASTESISWMLLGSVGFFMAIIYLANWPQEDIRWYSCEIIGTSIQIFCGVLLFDSLNWCLEAFARSIHMSETAVLALIAAEMIVYVVVLQVVLGFLALATDQGSEFHHGHGHSGRGGSESLDSEEPEAEVSLRRRERLLDVKCWSGILAHVAAFAALELCLKLQGSPWFKNSPLYGLMVVPVVAALIWLLFMLTGKVRDYVILADDKMTHAEHLWDEETEESENDMISISISFALVNASQFWVFGKLPESDDLIVMHADKQTLVTDMYCLSGGIVCVVVTVTVLAHWIGGLGHHHFSRRTEVISVSLLSMIFAWMLLCGAKAIALYTDPEIDLDFIAHKIGLALVLTLSSFIVIYFLHLLGDRWVREGPAHQALVKVILSQGLLVGFSWEQCILDAISFVAIGHALTLGLSVLLCAIVIPAYRRHVLPMITDAKEVQHRHFAIKH